MKENVIEWITGDERISLTLTQKKHINKVKALARKHENEVDFIENDDGSIFAHLPLSALKLNIIKREVTGFKKKYEDDEDDD